jgi:hypothetical protein
VSECAFRVLLQPLMPHHSHFVTIPPGPDILSDIILSSPILREDLPGGGAEGEASGSGTAAANNSFEFGIDPSLDPELAMARITLFFDPYWCSH